jgi:hypothetical protein
MAGPNEGFRYIIVIDAIANAPAANYANGTIVYDSTTNVLSVMKDGAWSVITTA